MILAATWGNYENNAFSTIEIRWNDLTQQLTLAKRAGEYPGMAQGREFVVFLHGVGQDEAGSCELLKKIRVIYTGKQSVVQL